MAVIAPQGVGLGFRRELVPEMLADEPLSIQFLECAPENWINIGGRMGKEFAYFAQRYPIVCHGLSLSIGGPTPLDELLLQNIKRFLDTHNIAVYTEHLSYCSDDGQLYDLMPMPFTEEAVHYVAQRVIQCQEILERPIALENVSYYCAPSTELSELEFINAVLAESGCGLLLDVNNIYVNSINHHYDARLFLQGLQPRFIPYIHIAGHYQEAEDLIIDSHGAAVIDPVFDLLAQAYQRFGVLPTLLERDFHFPKLNELLNELALISQLQNRARS